VSELTLETLKEMTDFIKKIPSRPLSLTFASGLDAHCAIEAWQAKVNPAKPFDFQGIPVKVNPAIPENVMMFTYRDKVSFFNIETGKSWSIPVHNQYSLYMQKGNLQ